MQTLTPNTLPNYHFLFIAPGLGVEWFFDAARHYFDRFRPTVVTNLDFVRIIPQEYSFALTAIVRRDAAADWGVQLAQLRPTALYDPVVYETVEDAKRTLDQRAEFSQPFGVPLINETPQAVLEEGLLDSIPTPLVPMQNAEGWVTVTPIPTVPTTPTPPPTPLPTGDPIPPVEATPGSLIGG